MWLILIFGLLNSVQLIELLTEDKPLIQEIVLPKNINENQTVRLNCALIQGQSVDFEWFFNNEKLKVNEKRRISLREDASELIIRHVSVEDLGEYKCVATNRHSKDVQSVTLFVNGKLNFKTQILFDIKKLIAYL